jgi:hypothetical protein
MYRRRVRAQHAAALEVCRLQMSGQSQAVPMMPMPAPPPYSMAPRAAAALQALMMPSSIQDVPRSRMD